VTPRSRAVDESEPEVDMGYLEELLDAYRQGLQEPPVQAITDLRDGLEAAEGAKERGRLLAALARALVETTVVIAPDPLAIIEPPSPAKVIKRIGVG